jgi:hypothetical protein
MRSVSWEGEAPSEPLSGPREGEAPSEPSPAARTEPRPPGSDIIAGSVYEVKLPHRN